MTRPRAIVRACAVGFVLAAGCADRADVLPPAAPPSTDREAQGPAAEGQALQARDWSAFGMPVPTGAVSEEIGRTHAYYRIRGDLDHVVGFFTAELPDFAVTRYDQGVKLEARDRSDRSLYVYAADGDVLVTYYDQTPEAAPGATTTPGGAPLVTAPVVAPDGVSSVLTANGRGVTHARGRQASGAATNGGADSIPEAEDPSRAGSNASGGSGPAGAILPRSQGPRGLPMGGDPNAGGGPSAGESDPGATPQIRRATRPPGGYNRGFGVDARPRQLDFVHSDYERPTNPDAWF